MVARGMQTAAPALGCMKVQGSSLTWQGERCPNKVCRAELLALHLHSIKVVQLRTRDNKRFLQLQTASSLLLLP